MTRILLASLFAALGLLLLASDADARGHRGRLGFRAGGNCGSGQRALFQGLRGRRHRHPEKVEKVEKVRAPIPMPGKVPVKPAR